VWFRDPGKCGNFPILLDCFLGSSFSPLTANSNGIKNCKKSVNLFIGRLH
jgi:hypothetical protein